MLPNWTKNLIKNNMITIEDLKDFYIWKQWKNCEIELGEPEFKTKPGFV